ncbi:MAG: SH3 domain-containing protein [Cyanobium sp.]
MAWAPWRSLALLGFALVAPAGLPAGGAQPRVPELRGRGAAAEPLLSPAGGRLRGGARRAAPALAELPSGSRLRVLREWLAPNGHRWLQVEVPTAPGRPGRGWLPG